MRLKITIENVAPFKDVTVELSKPITILYGASGTGKTTLIEIVGCLLSALRDYKLAERCLDLRLDVMSRVLNGEGRIEILLELGRSFVANVKASIGREISIKPNCEGVKDCSEVYLEHIIIPENRHIPLYYASMIGSRVVSQLIWKLEPLMKSLSSSIEQIPEFRILAEYISMQAVFKDYIQLFAKIVHDPRLSLAASMWIRHVASSWIGRHVKNVDIGKLEIDGIPLYLDSLGVREFVSLIPLLVTFTGLDEYQRMGSPRLVTVDSLGLGLTRKELFLLSTALSRLIAKMIEEVEEFDTILVIATHSELVHEAIVLEASEKRDQIDELLKRDLRIESLLPPTLEVPKGSIKPEHYEVIELYTDAEGYTKCRSIQGLPDYVKRIDEVVFKAFYST